MGACRYGPYETEVNFFPDGDSGLPDGAFIRSQGIQGIA